MQIVHAFSPVFEAFCSPRAWQVCSDAHGDTQCDWYRMIIEALIGNRLISNSNMNICPSRALLQSPTDGRASIAGSFLNPLCHQASGNPNFMLQFRSDAECYGNSTAQAVIIPNARTDVHP